MHPGGWGRGSGFAVQLPSAPGVLVSAPGPQWEFEGPAWSAGSPHLRAGPRQRAHGTQGGPGGFLGLGEIIAKPFSGRVWRELGTTKQRLMPLTLKSILRADLELDRLAGTLVKSME